MVQPEVVGRSSRIQGTEESLGFRLELKELGGSSLRPREQGVSAGPDCERLSSAPQTGAEGDRPFQAETVGANRLGWREFAVMLGWNGESSL